LAHLGLLIAGWAGPLIIVLSFAFRFDLGLDAPWYLAELVALRYVPLPPVAIFLAWLGVAGQLTALELHRYAPYPTASERPRRGPIRSTIRRIALGTHAHRGDELAERRAARARR
jgi:hypothetical protein